MKCRHCDKRIRYRGRLCSTCRQNPAVAVRRQGHGDIVLPDPPMPEPTTALAGTAEKIAVLADRVSRLECLWNDQDERRIAD